MASSGISRLAELEVALVLVQDDLVHEALRGLFDRVGADVHRVGCRARFGRALAGRIGALAGGLRLLIDFADPALVGPGALLGLFERLGEPFDLVVDVAHLALDNFFVAHAVVLASANARTGTTSTNFFILSSRDPWTRPRSTRSIAFCR